MIKRLVFFALLAVTATVAHAVVFGPNVHITVGSPSAQTGGFHTSTGTVDNLTVTTFTATTATVTNDTVTNQTVVQSTITALTVSTFTATKATITTATITNDVVTNQTVTQSTCTSLRVTGTFGAAGVTSTAAVTTGFIGEYISQQIQSGSSVNLPDSIAVSIATVTLTAGDWDVSGVADFNRNGATITRCLMFLSAFPGNTTTDAQQGDNEVDGFLPTATANSSASIPAWRVSIAASAPYYLKTQCASSVAIPNSFGRISARRVR